MDDDVTMTLTYSSDETDSNSETLSTTSDTLSTISETFSVTSERYSCASEIYKEVCEMYGVISKAYTGMRLIDLNADCLNEIFKHLTLMDVIILANANLTKRTDLYQAFTPCTSARTHPYEATIRDHFKKHLKNDFAHISNDPNFEDGFEKLLQNFGTLVKALKLRYDRRYHRRCARMERIVCEYATSLTEICFVNADMSAFEEISKPFETVEHIIFEGGWVSQTLCQLGRWFPRLKTLMITDTQFAHPRFIEMTFPNLVIVILRNRHICRYDRVNGIQIDEDPLNFALSSTNIERFLILNPQLNRFTIYHDCADAARDTNRRLDQCVIQINSSLLEIIAIVPNLRVLKINIENVHEFDPGREVIQFRYIRFLIIEVKQINQLNQIMNIMSNRLEHLTITLNRNPEPYSVLCEFIGRFKYIYSLLIQHRPLDVRNVHFIEVVAALTKLKELQITLEKDNVKDSVCFLIEKFEKLSTITIRCPEVNYQDRTAIMKEINPYLSTKNRYVKYDCRDFIFTKILYPQYQCINE